VVTLFELAEQTEAMSMYGLFAATPEPLRDKLGMAQTRLGGGVAVSMTNPPGGGYWSKALGFGFAEPVTAALVSHVLDFYRERRNPRAVLQVAPSVLPHDWDDICAAHGITAGRSWIKLAGAAEQLTPGPTRLRVGPVEPAQLRAAMDVLLLAMGMPDDLLAELFTIDGLRDDVRVLAAWDGDEIVATARLTLHGESAELAGAATLPGHRGRGAHTALLAARGRVAAEAGCRWLVGETWKPTEAQPNPSLRAMLRAGLEPLYDRRNYRWTSDES
jgi:hypothetical protein